MTEGNSPNIGNARISVTPVIEGEQVMPIVKPGYQTSEFWITIVAQIISGITAIVPAESIWARIAALIVTLLTVLGYSSHRASLKTRSLEILDTVNRALRAKYTPLLAVMLIMLTLCGCSTPAKRYASTLVALDTANTSFNTAAKAHLLTDRQIVAAEPLFNAADRQAEILKHDYEVNATVNETALKSLNATLDAIEEWLIQTKARK